jgi:hypothetical protein
MLDILKVVTNLPLALIFVLAGLFFVLLIFVRKLSFGSFAIKILPAQQKLAGVVGISLILLGMCLYFLPAISAPVNHKVANATPVVTVSPLHATATPLQSQISASHPYGGRLALDDPLQNNNDGRWDQNAGCRFIMNAYYVSSTNFYSECADNSDNDFPNDAFQIKITLTQGSSGGIEFRRSPETSYYSFSIGWSGQYEFLKVDSHQQITTIFQGRVPQDGQRTYLVAVVANKSHFMFYINNIPLQPQNDSTYTDGSIFLFVDGSNEDRTPVTQAIFSDLKIWEY